MKVGQISAVTNKPKYKLRDLSVAFNEVSHRKNQCSNKTNAFEIDMWDHLKPIGGVADVEEKSIFLEVDVGNSRTIMCCESTGVSLAGNHPRLKTGT